MGAGIVVIVIAVAVGGLLVAAPKGIWWATQSWRFRNPEANEPSDVSYSLTRVGGVLTIIFGLVAGGMTIAQARDDAAADHAKRDEAAAEAAFVVPPPERRGKLPVVGYTVDPVPAGTAVDVFYLAPEPAVPEYIRRTSSGSQFTYPCYSVPTVTEGADGRVDLTVELVWAPQRLADVKASEGCRFGRSHEVHRADVGPLKVAPEAVSVHTDSAIAREDYTQVVPAGADNVVPRLDAEPDTNRHRSTVYDRGVVPIVGYAINQRSDGNFYLDITYLSPKGSDAHAGSVNSEAAPRGCEVIPFVTGLGTSTVTVDLRLRFADDGYRDDEDEERCALGASWSGPMTSSGGRLAPGTTVLTNGPIVNTAGVEQVPAAPGNRVPER